jgi:hypothetical protein
MSVDLRANVVARVGADPLGSYASVVGQTIQDFKKIGDEYSTRFPLHLDHHPSLRINPSTGVWYCDPCGNGGDIFKLYAAVHQLDYKTDFREVLKGLAELFGLDRADANHKKAKHKEGGSPNPGESRSTELGTNACAICRGKEPPRRFPPQTWRQGVLLGQSASSAHPLSR